MYVYQRGRATQILVQALSPWNQCFVQTFAQTFSPSLPPPHGGKQNMQGGGGATKEAGGQEGEGAVKLFRIVTRLLSLSLALMLGEET